MTRSVYLAARFSRQAEMRDYAAELARHGITVTSRWITGAHGESAETDLPYDVLARCAVDDLGDIAGADAVVLFTDSPSTRGGMWVELGYAIGCGIPVIVCGPPANIFCRLPEVVRVSSWPLVVSWLTDREVTA